MTRLTFVLVASLLGSSLVGCGDDDDTAGKPSSGLTSIPCDLVSAGKICNIYGEPTAASIQGAKDACGMAGGTVVDHCPSAGLIGCCLTVSSSAGPCYYDASTSTTDYQGICASEGAAFRWTTTAP